MKNLARWVRVGGPMLAGWLGDAASLVLAPWPTTHHHLPPPPPPRGKKEERNPSPILIKEKWNSSKILYSLLFYIFASTY